MPANSFQNAQCPNGKYAVPAGELHLLDEGDRNTAWDINVNPTTSWVEYDLGGIVPKGTKALYGFLSITNADAGGILQTRDGNSAETDLIRTRTYQHGSGAGDYVGILEIIKATDGKFDIREYGAANEISAVQFNTAGYFL